MPLLALVPISGPCAFVQHWGAEVRVAAVRRFRCATTGCLSRSLPLTTDRGGTGRNPDRRRLARIPTIRWAPRRRYWAC